MSATPQQPETILPLDDELTEDWSLTAKFYTGRLDLDTMASLTDRDIDSRGEQEIFLIINNGKSGITGFLTPDAVRGTQAEALKATVSRYKHVLGGLATKRTLIEVHMNVEAIVEELLQPYDFDAISITSNESDGPRVEISREEFNALLQVPEPHLLDVTTYARDLL